MNKFKKSVLISILLIVSSIVFFVFIKNTAEYTVLKIQDGDTVYIDFNNNGIAEEKEKKGLSDIVAFKSKADYKFRRQMRDYDLTQQEVLELGYLAKEFLKEKILNKQVKVKFTDKRQNYALLFLKSELVQDSLIELGLAVPYRRSERYEYDNQLIENAKEQVKGKELVILNLKNHKYHKPDCKYGVLTKDYELVEKKDLPKDAKPCEYCKNNKRQYKVDHNEQRTYKPVKKPRPQNIILEKPVPDIKTENIELYFIDPMDYKVPADFCRTAAVLALIKEINNAQKSIDFAVFGFSHQQELIEAIKRALARGIKIRWVTDMTPWGFNFYKGTKDTMNQIPNCKTDYLTDKRLRKKYVAEGKTYYNGTLIHNKFFIIDEKIVWTGSTNISSSGTGGYNANISAIIRSESIASLHTEEFE